MHEWSNIGNDLRKKGLSWKQKWHYLFGPPGWSHDGSRHTSDQLRKLEDEQKEKLPTLNFARLSEFIGDQSSHNLNLGMTL